MMIKLLIAIGLVALTANATFVSECDDVSLPINVDVDGCEEEPCNVVRGKDVTALMTFKAPSKVTKLVPDALATALGFDVPFPLEADGCEQLEEGSCPIQSGDTAVYKLNLPILKVYPLIPLQLKFTMKDQDSEGIFCFKIALKVVDG